MQVNHCSSTPQQRPVEINDDEHTLILMLRSMNLNEILYAVKLDDRIPMELPNKYHHITHMINFEFNKSYTAHKTKTIIEFIRLHESFEQLFTSFRIEDLIVKYQQHRLMQSCDIYLFYLMPFTSQCVVCNKSLKVVCGQRPKMLLTLTTAYKALISTSSRKDCDVEIYPKFYIENGKKYFTTQSIEYDEYVYMNGNQILHQDLLIDFDHHLIQNKVSFDGYTSAYNDKLHTIYSRKQKQWISSVDDRENRPLLNEKTFQMTWLLLNIAKFVFMTSSEKKIHIPMAVRDGAECNEYFLGIKDKLYASFVAFWTNHEKFTSRCDRQSCSKVFIIDGHQKPNRLVCQYKNVFDETIPELGSVQMGCLYSPLRKGAKVDCRYCHHHQPITNSMSGELKIQSGSAKNNELSLDKAALHAYLDSDGNYDDTLCNVYRATVINKKKISSYGFLATFLSCSVIVGFTEQPCSEGMRRVLHHLISILRLGKLPSAMCYDCACTLKLFIKKHLDLNQPDSTDYIRFLSTMSMSIDRFHVKNHKREMCKTVMKPDHEIHKHVYESINTQVAEQMFSYFSNFKNSFRDYNYPKSEIFYLVVFHLKNCVTVGISSSAQGV